MSSLLANKGIILGKDKDGFLIANDSRHILVYGPTGSGKGVSFVIPNLLCWEGSAVVHDPKKENFKITSGWRQKKGQKIYIWNPASQAGESHCYNPLGQISNEPQKMVDDVQRIAHLLLPIDEFWSMEARTLFVGIVLWLALDEEQKLTFGDIVRVLRAENIHHKLAKLLDTEGTQLHPVAFMNINAFLQKSSSEISGVLSLLNSALSLWTNPLIDKITSKSDFDFNTIVEDKITIYICVSPDNVERLKPLLCIFYDQLVSALCNRETSSLTGDATILFMMDDFPLIGCAKSLQSFIGYSRSYGVQFCTVTQTPFQIDNAQGHYTFLSNASYRIAYAPNDPETCSLISKTTHVQETKGMSKCMDEAQVFQLPQDKQILQIETQPARVTDKVVYYTDPFFKDRLLPAIPVSNAF